MFTAVIFTATIAIVVASSNDGIVQRVPPHSSPVFMWTIFTKALLFGKKIPLARKKNADKNADTGTKIDDAGTKNWLRNTGTPPGPCWSPFRISALFCYLKRWGSLKFQYINVSMLFFCNWRQCTEMCTQMDELMHQKKATATFMHHGRQRRFFPFFFFFQFFPSFTKMWENARMWDCWFVIPIGMIPDWMI